MTDDFQWRLEEALRRRLFPNSALHLKQVAGAIGRSENTVARWWRGETRISAEDLHRVAAFLAGRGDKNFLLELFGETLPSAKAGPAFEETVLALVRTAFAQLSGDAAKRDHHLWFTSEGGLVAAPEGHADYVTNRLRRLLSATDDALTYAVREHGWIALTVRSENMVTIRHDGRKMAPLAAERIGEWLSERGDRFSEVRRIIHLEGRWLEATHANVASAIDAITTLAAIARQPRRSWTVKQLPLDAISDSRLLELLRLYHQAPDRIIHAAATIGAFTTSSVLRVEGDDVVSLHVATSFGLDHRAIEGRNVLARADTDYGLMIKERALRIKREGALYHELSGTIRNRYVRYLNLGLPETGPGGRVLSSSVLLEG